MSKNYETTHVAESEVDQDPSAKGNENISEINASYNEYRSDRQRFINKWNAKLKEAKGPKIDRIEFEFNNDKYEELSDQVIGSLQNKPEMEANQEIMHSIIQISDLATLRIHNATIVSCYDGSRLRFCPYKNGIEISRIYVPTRYRGTGIGTLLMKFLLRSMHFSLGQFPEIMVECTGAIGYGKTKQLNDISKQIKFFRKFGFRVCQQESNHPRYVKMEFDLTKMNMINLEF